MATHLSSARPSAEPLGRAPWQGGEAGVTDGQEGLGTDHHTPSAFGTSAVGDLCLQLQLRLGASPPGAQLLEGAAPPSWGPRDTWRSLHSGVRRLPSAAFLVLRPQGAKLHLAREQGAAGKQEGAPPGTSVPLGTVRRGSDETPHVFCLLSSFGPESSWDPECLQ